MAIALEGILGVLLVQLLPLADQVWVQVTFTGGLGDEFARLDLVQDLLLELFGKDVAFGAHNRWVPFRSILH